MYTLKQCWCRTRAARYRNFFPHITKTLFFVHFASIFIDLVGNAILSLSMCDAWKLGRCDVNDCYFSDFHFHCGIWFFGVLFGTLEIWLNQNWIIDSIEWTDWCCFHWIRGFFCVCYTSNALDFAANFLMKFKIKVNEIFIKNLIFCKRTFGNLIAI